MRDILITHMRFDNLQLYSCYKKKKKTTHARTRTRTHTHTHTDIYSQASLNDGDTF
jgi:hypothetical protein